MLRIPSVGRRSPIVSLQSQQAPIEDSIVYSRLEFQPHSIHVVQLAIVFAFPIRSIKKVGDSQALLISVNMLRRACSTHGSETALRPVQNKQPLSQNPPGAQRYIDPIDRGIFPRTVFGKLSALLQDNRKRGPVSLSLIRRSSASRVVSLSGSTSSTLGDIRWRQSHHHDELPQTGQTRVQVLRRESVGNALKALLQQQNVGMPIIEHTT